MRERCRFQCFRQTCAGRTDGQSDSLGSLTEPKNIKQLTVESHLFSDLAANAGEDHKGPGEGAQAELAAIPGLGLGDVLSRGGES